MKSVVLFIVSIISILIMVTSCSDEVDIDKLYEAIADSFNPKIDIPFTQHSFTRINEIIPLDPPNGNGGTRFIYETDTYSLGTNNIRFIWNATACDNSFTYLKWDNENILREAFIGNATPDFNPADKEQLEAFLSESDTWLFSYDIHGWLAKVSLKDDPGTYRRFTYNTTRDFYDSIIDYRQGQLQKILNYQYAADNWELLGVLELSQVGDTTAIYTYEPVAGEHQLYMFGNPLFSSRLISIPNATCNYLFLHGPLWAWHFPAPVGKLYKDGDLVYEVSIEYETTPAYPSLAHYSRADEDGIMKHYSEKIVTEIIQAE